MKYSTGLPEAMIREYATKVVPWGPVGYVTYKRTYARLIPGRGRTEEWYETCARGCNGLIEIGALYTQKEIEQLYDFMFNLKGCVSGRALWQLGTETVERLGANSLCACWLVTCHDLEAFCFAFNQLMLGGGVGFNVQAEYVYQLPQVKFDPPIKRVDSPDCDLIVPDNREGWVNLLRQVLQSFFVTGKPLTYSTQCIRAAGKEIISFGGVASGSEPLVQGIKQIIAILRKRAGQKLRPIDCVDIGNIIGVIVVSGNVRRSAEIMIGDPRDLAFLNAKNWNKFTIPNWRKMSNNAVACNQISDLLPEYWDPYHTDGECYGLVNLHNCRRYGRLIDGSDYRPDTGVKGCNPCGEANVEDKEPCNLAETYLPRVELTKEFPAVTRLLYKATKTIANYHYLDPETEEVVHRNMRVGISITGCRATRNLTPEHLSNAYRSLEQIDEEYSKLLGVPTSSKLTCVKPSGTLSLLPAGISAGMGTVPSRYLIRRIRFSSSDLLVEMCRQNGYHVEPELNLDGTYNHGTMVVEFPMDYGPHATTEPEIDVINELEYQRMLQTYWADQSISCTHYFKPGEVETIQNWLAIHYSNSVKTCSFMHSKDHGFKQLPLEAISQMKYLELCSKVKPVTHISDAKETDMVGSLECETGACPVK
jgi:ribonucleotide reductase alpha subunit